MRVEGTNKIVGWVEPGAVPTTFQSPSVVILWLAYCSGSFLHSEIKTMRPVWVGGIDNNNRQGKCDMQVQFDRGLQNSRFTDNLNYLCDGRANPCQSKDAENNLLPPPFNTGFTQAVFRVESASDLGSIKAIPTSFRLNVYMPKWGSSNSEASLRVSSSISGVVTNLMAGVQVSDWIPKLPQGTKVGVNDYRFSESVTNFDGIRYVANGSWRVKTDKEVVRAVKGFSTAKKPPVKTETRAGWLRLVLLISLGLPVAGIYFFYRSTQKTKQEQKMR